MLSGPARRSIPQSRDIVQSLGIRIAQRIVQDIDVTVGALGQGVAAAGISVPHAAVIVKTGELAQLSKIDLNAAYTWLP
jgi:hypothetical protein